MWIPLCFQRGGNNMSSLNYCTSAILSRGELWVKGFETEPYEAGWAKEAIVFLHTLDQSTKAGEVSVQISPDGMIWIDEGATLPLPHNPGELSFVKIRHFGQFLRLKMTETEGYNPRRIIATLNLK
jgi:hypothetical protein